MSPTFFDWSHYGFPWWPLSLILAWISGYAFGGIVSGEKGRLMQKRITAMLADGRLTQAEADEILTGKPTPTAEKVN